MNLVDSENGALTDDPVGCAEILNSFFYSQFCQENKQMPEPEKCQDNKNIEVSIEGLVSLIKGLANGKSPGPDGIRKPDLLVDVEITAACLQKIYTASLRTGKLPDEWKLAHVTPIHKSGSKDLPNNYRPISLTSIPCKILEHIVLHYLNKTLDAVIHNRQHGFCKGLSFDTQLCSTYHDLADDTHVAVPTCQNGY